jgi:hypothetical protein
MERRLILRAQILTRRCRPRLWQQPGEPVAGKRYRVLFSTVYGGFGSDSAGGSSTGSGGGSSVGVAGAGGVFGIGKGLFGSGGVGGMSISARIKSCPLCGARLSCSLIEHHLQIDRILSVAFDSPTVTIGGRAAIPSRG